MKVSSSLRSAGFGFAKVSYDPQVGQVLGKAIADLTSKAMGGHMTFQDSLKQRLELIKPMLPQIEEFLKTHPTTLTPGVEELVQLLHKNATPVYLISGGFRRIIAPIAEKLNIPKSNIFANRLIFSNTGEYEGFDESELTSQSGGKGKVIERLKNLYGYRNVVMIGDGITDFEACPPGDAFIGIIHSLVTVL